MNRNLFGDQPLPAPKRGSDPEAEETVRRNTAMVRLLNNQAMIGWPRCAECGRSLTETPSIYLACAHGCSKLIDPRDIVQKFKDVYHRPIPAE